MHIPSERVYNEMRSERTSLWIVPANEGDELAVLIKAPTSVIKALVAGCAFHLIFGKIGPYLCTGARIFDVPDAPILIAGVQRQAEEHEALARLLEEKHAPVFLFNEMDVCLAWTNLEISESDAKLVSDFIGRSEELYVGLFTPECSHALDCFCVSVDPSSDYPGASPVPLASTVVLSESWRTADVSFVGFREQHTITIDHPDEGEIFERALWACLESVFPHNLYKSPEVVDGEKTRELTDVLACYEYGCFLIEAKDISVIKAGYERHQERRIKGIQKQVRKAIGQLVGAANAIVRGDQVIDSAGTELDLVRDKPLHCIVLVTELVHAGNWDDIATQLLEAMRATGAFFHLFDLLEFVTLLKGSSGKAPLLDYNLMERCKVVARTKNVHVRSQ